MANNEQCSQLRPQMTKKQIYRCVYNRYFEGTQEGDTNSLSSDISFDGVETREGRQNTDTVKVRRKLTTTVLPKNKNIFHSYYVLTLQTTLKSTMIKGTSTLRQWFQIRGHPEIRNLMDRNWMGHDAWWTMTTNRKKMVVLLEFKSITTQIWVPHFPPHNECETSCAVSLV